MAKEINIVGISGSLRAASLSRDVLRSIADMLPAGTQFSELDIGALPHYNEDTDGETAPEAVRKAREQVAQADAVVFVTPEYNHGIPGVLKNTLDWLSRPVRASCFLEKPVMFATISPGALGGVRAQAQMRETLTSMLCRQYPLMEIAVTHVKDQLQDHRLTNEATLTHIRGVLTSFLEQAGL